MSILDIKVINYTYVNNAYLILSMLAMVFIYIKWKNIYPVLCIFIVASWSNYFMNRAFDQYVKEKNPSYQILINDWSGKEVSFKKIGTEFTLVVACPDLTFRECIDKNVTDLK